MARKKIVKELLNRTVGYLRVSTVDQDVEKFKHNILAYANDKGYVPVEFVSERISGAVSWRKRKLSDLVDSLQPGDRLLVPELSRLGRSLVEVLTVINVLKDKEVAIYSVKEQFQLNGDSMQAKIMTALLALFAELERDLISMRTREALARVKASGKKLGRPRGPGKSKLNEHREEIIALLKNGSTKAFVCKRYGWSESALYNWLRRHAIDVKPEI